MDRVRTHYDNLKVARNAPPEVIRAAYEALSQKHGQGPSATTGDAARVRKLVDEAYAVLSDPERRRAHDEWIRGQEVDPPAAEPAASAPALRSLTRARKRLVAAVVATLTAMLVFPPFRFGGGSGRMFNAGYGWIFSPPRDGRAFVDVSVLLTEWVGVLLVGALAWLLLGGTARHHPVDASRSTQVPPAGSHSSTGKSGQSSQARWSNWRVWRTDPHRKKAIRGVATQLALFLALLILWRAFSSIPAQFVRPWGTDDSSVWRYTTAILALQTLIAVPFCLAIRRVYRSEGGRTAAKVLGVAVIVLLLLVMLAVYSGS